MNPQTLFRHTDFVIPLVALLSSLLLARAWAEPVSSTSPMREARADHSATLLQNGKVLVAGGYSGRGYLATAEVYDPDTTSWNYTGSLRGPRALHVAALLPSGKVLVAGGFPLGYTTPALPQTELYDPVNGQWVPGAPMRVGRGGFTATTLPDGRILVAGGYGTPAAGTTAEVYDPVADSWTPTGPLNFSRFFHTAALLPSGKVLVTGGTKSSSTAGVAVTNAELYDPETNLWTLTGAASFASFFSTSTLLPDGTVLLGGSAESSSLPGRGQTALYSPSTGSWQAGGPTLVPRERHTATLLRNGQVFFAGGGTVAGGAPCELYNPAAGTSKAVGGSAATGFSRHTATLLRSGKVLLAGGYSTDFSAVAQLYTPPVRGDLDGDGQPDLVLYNPADKSTVFRYLTGSTLSAPVVAPQLPPGWSLSAVADFDGNGSPDYFLSYPDGALYVWYIQGTTFVGGAQLPYLSAGWQLAAVEDFDADGQADLLWVNPSTGYLFVLFMKSNTVTGTAPLTLGGSLARLPAGWNVAAAVDADRNGRPDLVLYHPGTRAIRTWILSGTAVTSQIAGPTLAAGGVLAGVADFNRDGEPDLLVLDTASRTLHLGLLQAGKVTAAPYLLESTGAKVVVPAGYKVIVP